MHDTALALGKAFLDAYASTERTVIVEIGAMDINGSLRDVCPDGNVYIGLDVEHGKSVDIVITPGEPLPLREEFADLVLSTSQLEHDPRFWTTFLEMCRVTRDGGLIYVSTPSNGAFHSYPIDCWRFYPDAGLALAKWAGDNGYAIDLIESFTADRIGDKWNDFVAVFAKGAWPEDRPRVFLHEGCAARNIRKWGEAEVLNMSLATEDQQTIEDLTADNARLRDEVTRAAETIAALEARLAALGPPEAAPAYHQAVPSPSSGSARAKARRSTIEPSAAGRSSPTARDAPDERGDRS